MENTEEFKKETSQKVDIDEAVLTILDIKIDGAIPEEAKQLIHEAAEEARKTAIYKNSLTKRPKRFDTATAEDLIVEMMLKIIQAPTQLHMRAVPRLMLPAIDEAIRRQQA